MKILNFGSLNIDFVYSVDHIVTPGETIMSDNLAVNCGGKGLNQSIALSRAGAEVFHAGFVGEDGATLIETLKNENIDVSLIKKAPIRSGNAIIQVAADGQNSIVLFGGANQYNSVEHINYTLSKFQKGDWILLQNEINLTDKIIDLAYERNMSIALNPSPFSKDLLNWNLFKVNLLFINEVEGKQITDKDSPADILNELSLKLPNTEIILTLGSKGAIYKNKTNLFTHGIYDVEAIDTTAAGDTFTGYFLSCVAKNMNPAEALRLASIASSITVSRNGAAKSIPFMREVVASNLSVKNNV